MSKMKGKKSKGKASMKAMDLSHFEEAHDNVSNLSNEDYNPSRMEPLIKPDANFPFRNAKPLPNAPQAMSNVPRAPAKSLPKNLKIEPTLPPPRQEPIKKKEVSPTQDDYFSLTAAMDLKNAMNVEKFTSLSFNAVTQITDLIFYTMMTHNKDGRYDLSGANLCKTKCEDLKELDLSGCFNITDVALQYIPDVFPNLVEINMSGCRRITETGLHPLLNRCAELKKVNIRGTSVSILPYKAAKIDINTDGYPCISPEKEILRLQGTKIMEAPAYPKQVNQDLMKVCVIFGAAVDQSLIKYIKNDKDKVLDPLETLPQFKVNDRFLANFVQCHESICDLFITKRTVYIFTVSGDSDTKTYVAQMFGLICHIINKVHKAVFILTGLNSGSDKIPLEQIKNDISAKAKSKALSLRKTMEMDLSEVAKGMGKKSKDSMFTSIQKQEMAMTKLLLSRSLETLSIDTMEINLTKPFSGSDSIKPLISSMEKICTLYPEYQEMAAPIFKFTMLDSVDKMLKDGILSTECNKWSTQKILDLMTIMGRTMCPSFIDDVSTVCLIDWLAKVLKTAFTPPSTSTCKGRVNGVTGTTPMWELVDLKTTLQKVIGKEQGTNGASLLLKLGLSVYPSVFMSFKDLPSQPVVPLEQFFPEIPAIDKKKDLFYTVGYKASFSTPVPGFVLRQVLVLCSKLRRWNIVWQSGFIIQEGIVETLVEMREEKGDGSSLGLYTHTVQQHQGTAVTKNLQETVWNAILQYKIVIDYVLQENNIPHEMTRIMGQEPSKDLNVSGLISKHSFPAFRRQDESNSTATLCSQCGIQPRVSSLPWILTNYNCRDTLTDDSIIADDNVKCIGNVVKFQDKNKGRIFIKSLFPLNQRSSFKVHLLKGSLDKLRIGLGYGFIAQQKTFLGRIYIDFGTKTFVKEKTRDMKYELEATYPLTNLPEIGDDFCIFLKEKETNFLAAVVNFYKNTELIGSVDYTNHLFMPFMETYDATTGEPVNVMVYPMYLPEAMSGYGSGGEIQEGMKLEAHDRKTPTLMCVATVEKINTDGKLLIHFDGWKDTYDYWAEPTTTDIHPIGWMYHNMTKHKTLRQQLQKPLGYHDPSNFTWSKYFLETKSLPVPYDFFTAEQIEETPRDEEGRVMEALSLDMNMGLTCFGSRNRARVFEFSALQKCKQPSRLFGFFNQHSKFFSLLPRDMDLTKLQYPSLQSVMDFSKQNVHILCPGTKMELLHFLDDSGVPLAKFESLTEGHNAAFLQNCLSGILIQEETLPMKCSKLIPGIEKFDDKEQCEGWLQRLVFMYMSVLELHAAKIGKEANITMTREALEIFNTTVKDKQVTHLFSEGDRYVRCKGHAGSTMANNNLREIPLKEFANVYSFMTRLDFQNNQIQALPADFFKNFTALEYLNLSKNGISEFPAGIGNLKDLTEMDISSNRLEKLPADFEQLSMSLVTLNISQNNLNGLPAAIFKLTKLEELEAENIGVITDLSPIRNLMELKSLNVGSNHIAKIPDELGDLPLEYLDLSGVPWIVEATYQSYTAFMKQLNRNYVTKTISVDEQKKMFKKADIDESSTLTANEVVLLNNDILFPMYPRFGKGALSFEKTGGIPPVLFNLTKLKRLILCYHGITLIPDEMKVFKSLVELDLSYNPKMVSMSAEVGGLPLKQLYLSKCTALNTPPKEIVARGIMAVMGYLKRLRLGAVACKRTKLMMVGLGGAGKTSLVQSLMSKRYRAYMDHDEPITDGIDIKNWVIPVEGEKAGEMDNLSFSVWDFAGQTVYYNTHQFFLSNRAVYLLLWNVRQGYEHAGLDFWLSSVACHAPKAPILIVGTHIDKVEKFRLPEENLKTRYPQIIGFHYVSSYTGAGVEELRVMIIEHTLLQKYMGEKIPEAWLTLEKRLISYREEKKIDILPFKTLEGISATCGIFDKGELIQAVQFLHDLGAVQFFDTDFLRDLVVIYPQWIVDVMACLVTVHEGAVKDGRMLLKDIHKVWDKYPSDLHPWLLRLTEEFDLTCPLPDEDASIVPCLLPDSEPEYDWPHADPVQNIRESMTVYKFQYLPAGLFNRAQVRLNQYSKGALLWKTGSFMKKNDHIALMLQTDDQEVVVRAQGFRPENFLFIVHEMIETLIRESYSGVQYDFFIPCMDCQSRNVKDPSMMSYQKVKRALELSVPFLQCEKFFHMLSLQELKDAMPSDKMDEMDSHLRNSVRELIDLTHEKTISIFFVYSTKDVPELKDVEIVVHPGTVMEDMRSQDVFKISYTDKPESSDMEALTLSIKSNDVIIFGLSDNFAENLECKKLILYTKEVLQRPILLLLLGKTKNWQKGELNMPLGDEVFVDMTNKERYANKIIELYETIKRKDASKQKVKDNVPDCFISYCWTNSHDAIQKGSRSKEGALGWNGGDPRTVKKFLTEKGVKCWIDVERVGGIGLYTSIADGLREAKVMIAFVSDEYEESKNCVMEFRQSLITLRIPTIVVVVGTGYEWERKEVGLMAIGQKCAKVNMQFDNEAGYLQILNLVQENVASSSKGAADSKDLEKQRNIAFQEVMELTQRKFLRHMTNSFISNDLEPYPNLLIVDFITDTEKQEWETARMEEEVAKRIKEKEAKNKADTELAACNTCDTGDVPGTSDARDVPGTTDARDAAGTKDTRDMPGISNTGDAPGTCSILDALEENEENIEVAPMKSKYCFRLICEHTEGWHVMPKFIPFPEMDLEDEQQLIENAAAYLSRIYTIVKYSNMQLECLNTPEGEIFQQRLEEIGVKSSSDFREEYLHLRTTVMQEDASRSMLGLNRGHVNGKLVWLCNTHKKAGRSKTEERYKDKLATGDPIPTGDMPERYAPVETEAKEEPTPRDHDRPKKLFRRNISEQRPGALKRQTSQACNVM